VKFILIPILAASLAPGALAAQVSVNPAALAQLAGVSAPALVPAPATHATQKAAYRSHAWRRRPVAASLPKPPPSPPAAVPPAMPAVARPAPSPAQPALPKPAPLPGPVGIIFAADSADLPADAAARLAPFCKISGPIAVDARAPADPSDNSAAMRLSLARAMAVRAVLTACGVAPQNIVPRALGAAPGGADNTTHIQAGLNQ
jgi:hypothetical protein